MKDLDPDPDPEKLCEHGARISS